MARAIGICIHTGWGACVLVGGSLRKPEILANEIIQVLGESERFCFHRAAEMTHGAAEKWIAQLRAKAVANAKSALELFIAQPVDGCAIVAKDGRMGDLQQILSSHSRIHTAEGCFYRDIWQEASSVPTQLVAPSLLDPSKVGKIAAPPWGRDQKLAALAAWTLIN